MVSSGSTSLSGGGRKSFTLVSRPTGKSESPRLLIVAPPFPPITRSIDSDPTFSVGKPDCQCFIGYHSDAEQSLFSCAVLLIRIDLPVRILEGLGGGFKIHSVLVHVGRLFPHVPHETAKLSIHQ